MYVKIQTSEKGGNKGSCSDYANYLEKENEKKPEKEKEHFFSSDRDKVKVHDVIKEIDNNKKKLKLDESKFFSVTLAPSDAELKHIGQDKEKLKEFTRSAMDEYAKGFNREGLNSGNQLLYFAKIEQERTYKGTDQEVKQGEVKQGEQKEGMQTHIHVIVSRKDKNQWFSLSPLAASRNSKATLRGKQVQTGFDREKFCGKVEQSFDQITNYDRKLEDTFAEKLRTSKLNNIEWIEEYRKEKKEPLKEQEQQQEKQQEQAKNTYKGRGMSF